MTEVQLRQLLGCFLFSGDDVFKKIRVLSGGEKARVALAKTMIQKANFMLLDEPTNHLDMQSVEMLIEALNDYGGTLIIVSHDRYFISRTANKIWWIEDGFIKEFIGTYDEWHTWLEDREKKNKAAAQPPVKAPVKVQQAPPQEQKKAPDHESRARQKEYEKLQKKVERLEAELKKMNEEKTQLESQLGDPAFYADKKKFSELDAKYRSHTAGLQALNADYEQAFEAMMELEEKLA
jgi:ATP-binding cassette subfamily F protein 3